jgi:undecaprenyl diphosphate synthase
MGFTTMSNETTERQVPVHIGIIPDGNRRWAKQNSLPALEGHRRGAENFDRLMTTARDLGVKFFSSWAFSTENWKRSEEEKNYLFDIARQFTKRYRQKFLDEKARFVHIGRKDRLPQDIVKTLIEMEEETKDFTDFTVSLGMDYGGKDTILRGIKKLTEKGLEPTDENLKSCIDTYMLPPLDLLIRTGGEQRVSGFMLWELDYAELYFTKLFFPDFGPEQLTNAVDDFMGRERRFGGDSKK